MNFFEDNSLSSFTNTYPDFLTKSTTADYEVACESVYLDHRFMNSHFPPNETDPAIIVTRQKTDGVMSPEDFKLIRPYEKFFLPHCRFEFLPFLTYLHVAQKAHIFNEKHIGFHTCISYIDTNARQK